MICLDVYEHLAKFTLPNLLDILPKMSIKKQDIYLDNLRNEKDIVKNYCQQIVEQFKKYIKTVPLPKSSWGEQKILKQAKLVFDAIAQSLALKFFHILFDHQDEESDFVRHSLIADLKDVLFIIF